MEQLTQLDNQIKKILNQKYMLCATIKLALEEIESHLDNGEQDQWLHALSHNLQLALQKAVL